jgi:hypothetical protein
MSLLSLRGVRRSPPVLRLPRPRDKCLAGTLEAPSAEQLRKSEGRVSPALARHKSERRQDAWASSRLKLSADASIPAQRGLQRLLVPIEGMRLPRS